MSELGSPSLPLRVAVIGSGPSGFYAAEALLASDSSVQVDMFERLPAPFGLVRYGVAPDHAKIKNVIQKYEKTAAKDGFSFMGNVGIGEDIAVEELRTYYDAVVFASGAQTDRQLGIPGEDLPGSYTATEFVAWYNGHPEYRDREFDLSHEVAVVIGQGNVAMDVARVLSKTVDELKTTDISQHALDVLAESKVKDIYMIGRRGPAQAAFTPQEIKEFGELEDCDPVVDPASLELSAASVTELETKSQARKNYDTLKSFAEREPSGKSRRFIVLFQQSPKELLGDGRLEKVVLEYNELTGESGAQRASGTGKTHTLDCGALFRSVGYRGVPMDGVPFDERGGVFPNDHGKIKSGDAFVPGLYAVGWIKRGPSGIIGTNKPDAIETVKLLLTEKDQLPQCANRDSAALVALLRERGVRVVDYAAWQRIDAAEIERGKPLGKPREKFCRVDDMLGVLD